MTDVFHPLILVSTKSAKICTDSNLGLMVIHILGSKCKLILRNRKKTKWGGALSDLV